MDTDARVAQLFQKLCELPTVEWVDALEADCPGQPEVHRKVLSLLQFDADQDGDMDGERLFADALKEPARAPLQQLGRFVIEAQLGSGGMGTVWAARHIDSGVPVAIKTLRLAHEVNPVLLERFQSEVQALAGLTHPHIVTIYDQGTVQPDEATPQLRAGSPYLVMDLVEGGTLRDHLGRLDWPTLRAVLLQVLDALAHTHACGLIHRDIKPDNVLIDGALPRVRITDFGIAATRQTGQDHSVFKSGTPEFMAPEQVSGQGTAQGAWTDLYAVGVMGWTLACGQTPFQGEKADVLHAQQHQEPPDFQPTTPLPVGFEGWLRRLLEKAPSRRFAFAADAAWALRALDDAALSAARPAPLPTEPDSTLTGSWLSDTAPFPEDAIPQHSPAPPHPPTWQATDRVLSWNPLRSVGLGLVGLRQLPLSGRCGVRDTLWQALGDVRADQKPRAVLLKGPAGVGKSRLARWLCERAVEVGAAHTMLATHEELTGGHSGIAAMLGRDMGCLERPRDEMAAHIRFALSWSTSASPGEARALLQLLSPDTGRPQRAGERHRLALRAMLRRAEGRACVVWLDDVQWGAEAIALARFILSQQHAPVLLVLTARDDLLTSRPAEAEALAALDDALITRQLGPLPADDHLRFIRDLLGLTPALATRLAEQTAGSPMLAAHTVGDWVRQGLLEATGDGFRIRDGAEPPVPATLSTVWQDTLDALLTPRSPHDRRAVELGAVLGQEVSGVEWDALCEAAGVPVSGDLRMSLMERGLLLKRAESWAWSHGLIREAILNDPRAAEQLPRHHRACAALLRERGARPSRIGLHLWAAGDLEEAVTLLVDRIRWLANSGQGSEWIAALIQDGLDRLQVPPTDPRWLKFRTVEAIRLYTKGRPQESVAALRALASIAEASDDREQYIYILEALSAGLTNIGRAEEGLTVIKEALQLIETTHPVTTMRRSGLYSNMALSTGRVAGPQAALPWAQKAVDVLDADDEDSMPPALFQLALTLTGCGHYDAAERACARSIETSMRIADYETATRCWNVRGDNARYMGRPEEAAHFYRQALALGEIHVPLSAQFTRINLALLALQRDDASEAYAMARPVWMATRGTGSPLNIFSAFILLTPAAVSGRWEDWEMLLNEGERPYSAHPFREKDLPGIFRAAWRAALQAGARTQAGQALQLERDYLARFGTAADREALERDWLARQP